MRTIILRTEEPCSSKACARCHLVESALRRALGLEGHPLPRHVEGKENREMFVSQTLAVGIEHVCTDRALLKPGHVRLEVDGQRFDLPAGSSLRAFEQVFRDLLQTP